MKKNLLKLLMPVMAAVAFLGCQKEATELVVDLESAARKATVMGNLTYSKGQDAATFKENIVPAAGKKVYVDVPLSYYSSENPDGATKRFETTVKSDGSFSLEIPVTSVALSGLKLQVEDFTDKRNFFEQYVQDGSTYKPKFVEKAVLYKAAPVSLAALNDGKIEFQNIVYAYNEIGLEPAFKFMATLTFECLTPKEESKENSGLYSIDYKYVEAANTDVVIKVTHSSPAVTHTFVAKSNSEGLVKIDVPIKDGTEAVTVSVTSNPYNGTFKHYQLTEPSVAPTNTNLTGYFEAYAPINSASATLKVYDVTKLSNKFKWMFHPSPSDQTGAETFNPSLF